MKKLACLCLCLASSLTWAATNRDPKQVRAFRASHPCPASGLTVGSCPGWVVDHIRPLCFNGKDEPKNMQWQEREASFIKDVFEREACALKRKTEARK